MDPTVTSQHTQGEQCLHWGPCRGDGLKERSSCGLQREDTGRHAPHSMPHSPSRCSTISGTSTQRYFYQTDLRLAFSCHNNNKKFFHRALIQCGAPQVPALGKAQQMRKSVASLEWPKRRNDKAC